MNAPVTANHTIPLVDLIKARRSTRAFLPKSIPSATLKAIFDDARSSPSNCNTQPWFVEVVSGANRDKLATALMDAGARGEFTPDYPFDETMYTGVHGDRRRAQGALYYSTMGIARDDKQGRDEAIMKNLNFFGAPHAVFLFMPSYATERVAGDIGSYAQNLMLIMKAYGVDSCPQTVLGFFAQQIREILGMSDNFKLLFGISFGYADPNSAASTIVMPRAELFETTRFHG
ncbi:nitroreductase [Sphingobium sp. SA916]|uniref:nitroreductase n=1 Tax=Sphingobium sp. SA916 TaxID=1851207 RepID=UPI000C9EC9F0|nr:nitroreductase [Sphingobium sp. SA916]PNP97981.1 hypothetical protein A8G00_21185 [Sphingobium sp. SA916]